MYGKFKIPIEPVKSKIRNELLRGKWSCCHYNVIFFQKQINIRVLYTDCLNVSFRQYRLYS